MPRSVPAVGLVDDHVLAVSADVIVNEADCGPLRGIETFALKDNEDIVEPLAERILGRVAVHDIIDPLTDEIILVAGNEIKEDTTRRIDATAIETVEIRSVLTCESTSGCLRQVLWPQPGIWTHGLTSEKQ